MKRFAVAAALFVLGILAVVPVRADDDLAPEPVRSRNEFYVGLLLPYQAIGGDVDGNRVYSGPDGVAAVPDPKNALGGGLMFGIKSDRPSGRGIALEGSLEGSHHESAIANGPASNLALISADFKFFPTTAGNIQPWLQLGLCSANLTVENGFFSSGNRKNATFTGSGINLGAGLLAYASPRVAFHLAAIYRFIRYTRLDYGQTAKLDPSLNGNMLSVELGLSFRFRRG